MDEDELDKRAVAGDMVDIVDKRGRNTVVGMLQVVGNDKVADNVQDVARRDNCRVGGMPVGKDKRQKVRQGKRVPGLLLDSKKIGNFNISCL